MKYFAIIVTVFLICSCKTLPKPEPFTVDLRAPRQELGKIEAYFNKMLSIGGLNKDDVTVYYCPSDDAVGLDYGIQLVECSLFLDESGREAFINALERYKEEYEQRTLIPKKTKTREAYGSVEGFLAWKKTKISVQASGTLKIYFGYQFKDELKGNAKETAVYFTITQMEANYDDPQTRSRSQTSQVTMIFFTRAQAEKLAALFNEDHFKGLRSSLRSTGAAGAGYDRY